MSVKGLPATDNHIFFVYVSCLAAWTDCAWYIQNHRISIHKTSYTFMYHQPLYLINLVSSSFFKSPEKFSYAGCYFQSKYIFPALQDYESA